MGMPLIILPVCFASTCLLFFSCASEAVLFFVTLAAAGFAVSWAGFASGSGFTTSCEAAILSS